MVKSVKQSWKKLAYTGAAALGTAAIVGVGIATPAYASQAECSVANTVCVWTDPSYSAVFGMYNSTASSTSQHDSISSLWVRYGASIRFSEDTGYAGRNFVVGSGGKQSNLHVITQNLGSLENWGDRIDSFRP